MRSSSIYAAARAILIAAPLSAYLMSIWLSGFAYHVDLTPWPFLGAAGLALAIAALTVSTHCQAVARAKPCLRPKPAER